MDNKHGIEPLFSHPRHVRLRAMELAIEVAKIGGADDVDTVLRSAEAIRQYLWAGDDEPAASVAPAGPNAGPRMSEI